MTAALNFRPLTAYEAQRPHGVVSATQPGHCVVRGYMVSSHFRSLVSVDQDDGLQPPASGQSSYLGVAA